MNNVFDAIAWAISVSRGEPMPARMLLIVGLAQRVSKEGFTVWPSVDQICQDTDMGRTSVKKWMRHLEEKGFVQRFEAKRENGTNSSNRYRLAAKSVHYHPTKGAMPDDEDRGRDPTGRGRAEATGRGRSSRPPIELPQEQPIEDSTVPPEELDLGLPPVQPRDPSPSELAAFIAEQWASRAHATPLRGGGLSEANTEKAMEIAKRHIVGDESVIDVWRDVFKIVDGSDFLQGKVPATPPRTVPFKLSLSFLLEKRNFDKVLGGRFNGQSTGERRRGSTSEATSRVLNRIRSGSQRGAGGGNQGGNRTLAAR